MTKKVLSKRLRRYWVGTALTIFIVLAIAGVALWHSGTFEECLHKIPYDEARKEYGQGLAFLAFFPAEWFGCLGPFVDTNANTIVAVFTMILAVATVRLWVSTNRLWEGAEESNERQLRAYVLVENGNVYDASRIGLNSTQPNVAIWHQWTNYVAMELNIKNTGQTPAKNVRHWGQLAISSAAEEHTLIPPDELTDEQASVIGPGITVSKTQMMLPFPLAEPVLTQLKLGEKGIYVYGKIVYEDWFGVTRKTIYRLRYVGNWPPMPNGTLSFCLAGNDAN